MRLQNIVLVLVLGAIWGTSFVFVKVALRGFPPFTVALLRTLAGLAVLYLTMRAMGLKLPRDRRSWRIFAALGFLSSALPFLLMNASQQRIDASLATILISATPLFTLVLAHFFSDDRFSPRKVAGAGLGFAGVVLLVGPAALGGLGRDLAGQLYVIAAALCFAIALVIGRRLVTGQDPVVNSVGTLAAAALFLLPPTALIENPGDIVWRADAMLALAGLGFLSTGIAYIIYYRLNARAGPNFVSMNNFVAPIFGLVWGIGLLGERPGWAAFAALAVILAGVATSTWKGGIGRPKG